MEKWASTAKKQVFSSSAVPVLVERGLVVLALG